MYKLSEDRLAKIYHTTLAIKLAEKGYNFTLDPDLTIAKALIDIGHRLFPELEKVAYEQQDWNEADALTSVLLMYGDDDRLEKIAADGLQSYVDDTPVKHVAWTIVSSLATLVKAAAKSRKKKLTQDEEEESVEELEAPSWENPERALSRVKNIEDFTRTKNTQQLFRREYPYISYEEDIHPWDEEYTAFEGRYEPSYVYRDPIDLQDIFETKGFKDWERKNEEYWNRLAKSVVEQKKKEYLRRKNKQKNNPETKPENNPGSNQ
jgi:hypothetical protein